MAAAGGWQDVGTLIDCYQQPDAETLLKVMEGRGGHHDPEAAPEKRTRKRTPHVG